MPNEAVTLEDFRESTPLKGVLPEDLHGSYEQGDEAPLSDQEQANANRLSDFAANAKQTRPERLSDGVASFLGVAQEYVVEPLRRPIAQVRKGIAGIAASTGIISPEEFQQSVAAIDHPSPLLPPATGPESSDGSPPSTGDKIFTGVANGIIDFVNGMTDPDAALQLFGAAVPSTMQKTLLTLFAVSMGKEAPGQLVDAADAAKRGDVQEAARLATGGIGATVLSTLMAKHANAPVREAGPLRPGDEFKSELPNVTESSTELKAIAPQTAAVVGRATELPKVEPVIEEPAPEIKSDAPTTTVFDKPSDVPTPLGPEAVLPDRPTPKEAPKSEGGIPSPEESARWDAVEALNRPRVERLSENQMLQVAKELGIRPFYASKEKFFIDIHPDDLTSALDKVAPEKSTPSLPVVGETVAPEPVKAVSKAQSEVTKVAEIQGQATAKKVKSALVEEIEKAIEDAPSVADLDPKQKEAFDEAKRLADVQPRSVQALKERNISHEASMDQAGLKKITIEIPGDGTFKIWNTKEHLGEVLKRAEKLSTRPGGPVSVSRIGISKADKAEVERLTKSGGGETALSHPHSEPLPKKFPPGPGAMSEGEVPQPAIAQLTDQLKAAPSVGVKEKLSWREAAADKWAEGKSIFDRAIGRMRAISESLKETARGVRTPTDLDRRLGEFDFALQRSTAQSKAAGKAIERQIKNKTLRDATSIWIDAGGDQAAIADTIANLPDSTKSRVRRALELAARLPQDGRDFANSLQQFFGIRASDAVEAEVMERALGDYFTHVWEKESNMPDSLRGAMSSGRLNTYFQFGKKRTISTLLEGIRAGKTPELDPAKVVPFYNYSMDRAIASRRFIKEASDLDMADGRPGLAPTGVGTETELADGNPAMMINPRAKPEQIADYHAIDHPAMRKWKYAGADESGKQTFYRGDLVAHPQIYERLARFMERSRLTPTATGKVLLRAGMEVKGFKLGLLSAFHQVHVGSHALWHWTNPFRAKAIDWDAAETKYAVEKGHLKLAPNPAELNVFAEGILSPGLVHKIPIIGPWSRAYSEWLFTDYIPRLKLATFENALKRNREAYRGKLSEEEIASRVGDAVNNAYGELNHLFLGKMGRDPKFQRILQGWFLAPDFGEARLRFVEKAFTRYGHEERLALATMFLTLYTAARVGNWSSHGDPEWDWKRAFSVKAGEHWYSMRSVIGDIDHALADFGQFMRVRLSPLYTRTMLEFLTGRDGQGKQVGASEQLKDVARQLVPIAASSTIRDDQSAFDGFISAMGLSSHKVSYQQDIGRKASEWLKTKGILREKTELSDNPNYASLRKAARNGNQKKVSEIYRALLRNKTASQIRKTVEDYPKYPFTGSAANEKQFKSSLNPSDLREYFRAKAEREREADHLRSMLK